MAKKSTKNSSTANNSFNLTKEWEEVSKRFTSQLQKEVVKNMKGSLNPEAVDNFMQYSDDFQKFWKKLEQQVNESTKKNMKLFTPAHFSKPYEFAQNEDWENFWKKVAKETQTAIDTNLKEFFPADSKKQEKSTFGSEGASKIFFENMEKAIERIERIGSLQKTYFQDVQELFLSSINNAQKSASKSFSNPKSFTNFFEAGNWQDRSAFSTIEKIYQLNTKLLQDTMKL